MFGSVKRVKVTDLHTNDVMAGLADGSMLVVDVREPHEFAAGHIPGSVLMPLSAFDPANLPAAGSKRVVFSCAAGIRSVKALEIVQAAGIDLVEHYKDGFKGWVADGGLVEAGEQR
jgi:rhodanese-related sulfurtransferase